MVASDTAKELQLEFHALWVASTSCGRNLRKLHGSFYLKCVAAMEARKPLSKSSWIRVSNIVALLDGLLDPQVAPEISSLKDNFTELANTRIAIKPAPLSN